MLKRSGRSGSPSEQRWFQACEDSADPAASGIRAPSVRRRRPAGATERGAGTPGMQLDPGEYRRGTRGRRTLAQVGHRARRIDGLARLCAPKTSLGNVHGYHVDGVPDEPLSLELESVDEASSTIR